MHAIVRQNKTPMPIISSFYGILVRMYFDDHAPPHFHVEYAGKKAVIGIEGLHLMEGGLPRRALELVLDWAELHQTELLDDWKLCQSHQQPKAIAPLL